MAQVAGSGTAPPGAASTVRVNAQAGFCCGQVSAILIVPRRVSPGFSASGFRFGWLNWKMKAAL